MNIVTRGDSMLRIRAHLFVRLSSEYSLWAQPRETLHGARLVSTWKEFGAADEDVREVFEVS